MYWMSIVGAAAVAIQILPAVAFAESTRTLMTRMSSGPGGLPNANSVTNDLLNIAITNAPSATVSEDDVIYEFPSGVIASFAEATQNGFGSNAVWSVSVTNGTEVVKSVDVTLSATKISYNGTVQHEYSPRQSAFVIPAGACANVMLEVSNSTYLPWRYCSDCFEVGWAVVSDGDRWTSSKRCDLAMPIGMIQVVQRGESSSSNLCAIVSMKMPIAVQSVTMTVSHCYETAAGEQIDYEERTCGPFSASQILNREIDFTNCVPGVHRFAVELDSNSFYVRSQEVSFDLHLDE